MIISVNWLKKFVDIDLPIDHLTTLIGARLVEIEQVINLSEKYKDVVVAKVIEAGKLEGTDHLNLTKIDDGGVNKDIERDGNGLIQVVCGADNVRVGMLVAWLPPNSIVPETFDQKEPVRLTAKNLRGVVSNGMLASARELGLGDGHDGIVDIVIGDAKPGDNFAEIYELNDYLLDIENKSLTHRPDAFGVIGFAREVAGILGKDFHSPEWFQDVNPEIEISSESVEVPKIVIDDPQLSDRYQGIVFLKTDGPKDANQLSLMATLLARSGVRPINPIVDVTNFMMLLTGQPLHAFDYDKLLGAMGDQTVIHVRSAKPGEKLALLDGRTIDLDEGDIVIATSEKPLSLAGAMGGVETEIDTQTKRVFLESATFNLYNLRSTQMRHGIFSEAITRFTKGQPAGLTAPVIAEAARLLKNTAGLEPISKVGEDYPDKSETAVVTVSITKINEVLGTDFSIEQVAAVLKTVEFDVLNEADNLRVTVPYWRADIHIAEDIIEEVGRLNGYDTIEPTLPTRDFGAVNPSDLDKLRAEVRAILARAGANEVLTYSFVHGDVLNKVGQVASDSYRITNSLSPDLQYYRQSLTPSLLQLIHPNIKNGFDNFAIFEINKVHPKQRGMTDENVPDEANAIALSIVSKKAPLGSPYYQAKKFAQYLGDSLGLSLDFTSMDQDAKYPTTTSFEPRRSATVTDTISGEQLGVVGEYRKSVIRNFKLPDYVAGFEFDVNAVLRAFSITKDSYKPSSRYPSTDRDVCFMVLGDTTYKSVADAATEALRVSKLEYKVSPVDIYEPEDANTKNITIRINLTAHNKTLTGDDVNNVMADVIKAVIQATNATVV